jgi:hypothetical protein
MNFVSPSDQSLQAGSQLAAAPGRHFGMLAREYRAGECNGRWRVSRQ